MRSLRADPGGHRRGARRASWRSAAALGLLALAAGCTTLQYYTQAIAGHLEIMSRAQPASEELDNPALPERTREHLRAALRIREFASKELGLPDNRSYRTYVNLDRPFAVWNVVAADEFSIKPKESCFPIAGCVAYRGFYSERGAQAYADSLAKGGDDVFEYGVPAYSTLGWFNDPLLSTFIELPPSELARLIFHELAHQVVYVKDDSAFDESFAVAVEEEGMRRWIAAQGSPSDREQYETLKERRQQFTDLVLRYQDILASIYASGMDKPAMREAKRNAFAQMKRDYLTLRESWHGWPGYDRWFASDLNNAHLASVATYTQWVGAFKQMMVESGGDLPAFYGAVRALSHLDKSERDAKLEKLSDLARREHADPI